MLDMCAMLTVKDGGEGDDLGDGTVVLHCEDGLELLYEAALWGIDIVLHISLCIEVTLILQMIHHP